MMNGRLIAVLSVSGVVCLPLRSAGADKLSCSTWYQDSFEAATVADVSRCLASGADLTARSFLFGATALHMAAGTSKAPPVVQALLQAGADPKARDTNGGTPLHRTAAFGDTAMVKVLLEAGADLEARDREGWTPLYNSVALNRAAMVKVLLEAGADPEARAWFGFSALHTAAKF